MIDCHCCYKITSATIGSCQNIDCIRLENNTHCYLVVTLAPGLLLPYGYARPSYAEFEMFLPCTSCTALYPAASQNKRLRLFCSLAIIIYNVCSPSLPSCRFHVVAIQIRISRDFNQHGVHVLLEIFFFS